MRLSLTCGWLSVPIENVRLKFADSIVEQGHRFNKRLAKPMLWSKSIDTKKSVLAGMDLIDKAVKVQYSSGRAARFSRLLRWWAKRIAIPIKAGLKEFCERPVSRIECASH
jgi:transposase-like protein